MPYVFCALLQESLELNLEVHKSPLRKHLIEFTKIDISIQANKF